MKESTGGALLMGLAAVIIMIFIIVVAFFISYGKSFRLKNEIINKLEQQEGMTKTQVRQFFIDNSNIYNGKEVEICYQKYTAGGENLGFSYKIIVYMKIEASSILGELRIPIKGETRMIEKGYYFDHLPAGTNQLESIKHCSRGYTPINV